MTKIHSFETGDLCQIYSGLRWEYSGKICLVVAFGDHDVITVLVCGKTLRVNRSFLKPVV